jgi:hypothetical protein
MAKGEVRMGMMVPLRFPPSTIRAHFMGYLLGMLWMILLGNIRALLRCRTQTPNIKLLGYNAGGKVFFAGLDRREGIRSIASASAICPE